MINSEKFALLLCGSPTGCLEAIPAGLILMARAGLQRVIQANLTEFVVVDLVGEGAVQGSVEAFSQKEFRDAARGFYTSHPLAVALAQLSVARADPGVDNLFGHLVLACLTDSGPNSENIKASQYSACLGLRKLIDKGRPEMLDTLLGPNAQLDLVEHHGRLVAWRTDLAGNISTMPGLLRVAEDLERFHAFLANKRPPRPGRQRISIEAGVVHEKRSVAEDEPLSAPTASEALPASVVSDQKVADPTSTPNHSPLEKTENIALAEDTIESARPITPECLEETVQNVEQVGEAVDECEITHNDPPTSIVRPIASPRQRLPIGQFQVRALRTATQDLALANPATIRSPDIELLVAELTSGGYSNVTKAVVAAGLYGGQPPDRMSKWSVVESIDSVDFSLAQSTVVLKPYGLVVPLEATKVLPKVPDEMLSVVAPAVFLPWCEEWRGLRALSAVAQKRVGNALFTVEEIDSAAEAIKQLSAHNTTALSLRRICKMLNQRIRDASDDIVIEALIAGTALDVNKSARFHYFQTTVKELADFYWVQAEKLHCMLGGVVTQHSFPPLPFAGTIGSQRCPSTEALTAWVTLLQLRVGTPPRGRPYLPRVSEFSNLFCAYVIEHIRLASGVRPYNRGMESLEPVGSTLMVDEKNLGVAALRQIPLSYETLKLWNNYLVHREWVKKLLKLTDCPLFFSVSPQGNVTPLTYSLVRELSQCPFAANSNRHYFGNVLRRAGLSGSEVNAMLGHASLGEEVGNRYSTLDIRKLGEKAVKAIEISMAEAGWKAIEGFGRG